MQQKKKYTVWLCYLILFLCALVVCLATPIDIMHKKPIGDTSMFMYIGKAMKNGAVLYRDTFDHKGPLLFFINYLGVLISESFGIWLLGLLSVNMFFVFVFKISNLIANKIISLFTAIVLIPILFGCLEGGNLSEQYALPFIAFGLFVFTKYFLYPEKVKRYEIFLNGVCLGAVFLLRANMICIWLVYCLAALILFIWKRQWKPLRDFSLFFLAGFVSSLLPFLIYFTVVGSLGDAIYQSFTFNILYSKYSGGSFSAVSQWGSDFLKQYSVTLILAIYAAIAFIKKRENIFLHIINFCAIFVSLYFIYISKREYLHYFMILIPLLAFPTVYMIKEIWHYFTEGRILSRRKNIVIISVAVLLMITLNFNYINLYKVSNGGYLGEAKSTIYSESAHYIKENSSASDTIYTHRLTGGIYLLSERYSATKYFCLPATNLDYFPDIESELFKDLNEKKPKFIVIDNIRFNLEAKVDQLLTQFLKSYYKFQKSFESLDVYELN